MKSISLSLGANHQGLLQELQKLSSVTVVPVERTGLDGTVATSLIVLFNATIIPKLIDILADHVNKESTITVEVPGKKIILKNANDPESIRRVYEILENLSDNE